MKVEVTVPEYAAEIGLRIDWEPEAVIQVAVHEDEVLLKADRGGLVTLGRLLLSLAQDGIEDGFHVHLDPSNGLQDGSAELIIEVGS